VSTSIVEKHLMQHGRHPLYCGWKGPRDLNLFDEEWATSTRCSTSQEQGLITRVSTSYMMGRLLDKGIDVENLSTNGFMKQTHIHPLHILET
jgi:hypothetical protein